MKEILQNNFEVAYKEFKEYETFLKNAAPKIKESREQFVQFSQENNDNTALLTERLFEDQVIPTYYQNDLLKLQNKVITVFETVKDVLEIPAEIKTEVEALIPPKQMYKITAGTAEEIDPEHNSKIKEEAKKYYQEMLEKMMK